MQSILDGFKPLDNLNTKLWRYMDFTKCISMLEYDGLYFPRADKLGDPFEGSWRKPFLLSRATIGPVKIEGVDVPPFIVRDAFKVLREFVVISCWHMNEYESDAMWSRYGGNNNAVAVQTTYTRLRAVLPAEFRLGRVKYVDFTPPPIDLPAEPYTEESLKELFMNIMMRLQVPSPELHQHYHGWLYLIHQLVAFWPQLSIDSDEQLIEMLLSIFLQKRKAFGHEQELRAMAFLPDVQPDVPMERKEDNLTHPTVASIWQPLCLPDLIEHIYVAPGARSSFLDLLKCILTRYRLDIPVDRTSMDAEPIF